MNVKVKQFLSFLRSSQPFNLILSMPGLKYHVSSEIRVLEHYTAQAFLAVTYPTLCKHERSSNIILAHALKKISVEAALTDCQFVTQSEVALDAPSSDELSDSLWLTVWTTSRQDSVELDLVLACHRAGQHELPVFLWAAQPRMLSSPQWLAPRVTALADRLASCVPPTRAFSVFGMTALVKAFSKYWTSLTGFQVEPQPFYSAYLTYCTKETITDPEVNLPFGHLIRRGMSSDIEDIAKLGKRFADDSVLQIYLAVRLIHTHMVLFRYISRWLSSSLARKPMNSCPKVKFGCTKYQV